MENYGEQINALISHLAKLPGIGRKSATRLAFYLIAQPKEEVEELAEVIRSTRGSVQYCQKCCTVTDQPICPVCADARRNQRQIMVVETTRDMMAYERTGRYDGVYHVLNGVISPQLDVGPDDIRLMELMKRVQGGVDEVIVATNATLEGETTALYIARLLEPLGIQVSRIASGVPVGGDIENIDEVTLLRALEGRTAL